MADAIEVALSVAQPLTIGVTWTTIGFDTTRASFGAAFALQPDGSVRVADDAVVVWIPTLTNETVPNRAGNKNRLQRDAGAGYMDVPGLVSPAGGAHTFALANQVWVAVDTGASFVPASAPAGSAFRADGSPRFATVAAPTQAAWSRMVGLVVEPALALTTSSSVGQPTWLLTGAPAIRLNDAPLVAGAGTDYEPLVAGGETVGVRVLTPGRTLWLGAASAQLGTVIGDQGALLQLTDGALSTVYAVGASWCWRRSVPLGFSPTVAYLEDSVPGDERSLQPRANTLALPAPVENASLVAWRVNNPAAMLVRAYSAAAHLGGALAWTSAPILDASHFAQSGATGLRVEPGTYLVLLDTAWWPLDLVNTMRWRARVLVNGAALDAGYVHGGVSTFQPDGMLIAHVVDVAETAVITATTDHWYSTVSPAQWNLQVNPPGYVGARLIVVRLAPSVAYADALAALAAWGAEVPAEVLRGRLAAADEATATWASATPAQVLRGRLATPAVPSAAWTSPAVRVRVDRVVPMVVVWADARITTTARGDAQLAMVAADAAMVRTRVDATGQLTREVEEGARITTRVEAP